MTVELETAHLLGPTNVDDWLAEEQPTDGSRLELILGYLYVTPPPGGPHQYSTFHLARVLHDAVLAAGRTDLTVLPGVGVKISTAFRTALIPDISLVDADINHVSFAPENLVLAVEVWSAGNTWEERDTKIAAYANAGVRYLWIVETPKDKPLRFWGYQLAGAGYRQMAYAAAGETVIAPAPVPVTLDTAVLR